MSINLLQTIRQLNTILYIVIFLFINKIIFDSFQTQVKMFNY